MGIPANRINLDSFILYANLCEEMIAAKSGPMVQRYTCDGVFSTADSHETIINTICLCMGTAIMVDVDGWYGLIGGYDDTATTAVPLDGTDIISSGVWNPASPLSESFNIVSGRFADPTQGYALNTWGQIEVDPLADGICRTNTVDFGCVDRAATCQRIAKQMVLREKYSGTFLAVFGPKAFSVSVGSLVSLSLPQFGFASKLFRVIEQEEAVNLLFKMTLREESAEIYAWDANEELDLPATLLESTYDPVAAEEVLGLAVSARSVIGTGSVTTVFCDVVWTPPQSLRTISIEIQARAAGQTNWTTEVERFFEVEVGTYPFAIGVNGVGIEVQARYRMSNGAYGDWASATLGSTPVSSINQWDAIYDGGTGTKPADGATNTANPNTPFGSDGHTVASIIQAVQSSGNDPVDTTPPGVPTGLTATSSIATDGTIDLLFSWTANSESNLGGYILEVSLNGGGAVAFAAPGNSYVFHGLQPNTPFSAQIAGVNNAGDKSAFSAAYNGTTIRDTTPPAPPTNLPASASAQSIFLAWVAPADLDVSNIQVFENTSNSSASATLLATVNALPSQPGAFTRSGLATGGTRYYWLKAVDTSGNTSSFSTSVSIAPAQLTDADLAAISAAKLTGQITTTQISNNSISTPKLMVGSVSTAALASGAVTTDILAANSVVAGKIATGAVTADSIQAGSISGDKISSTTSLPASLTIGNTGFQLGTVQGYAAAGQAAGVNRVILSDFNAGTTGFGLIYQSASIFQSFSTSLSGGIPYVNVNFSATASGQSISFGSTADFNKYMFPVTPGETLAVQAALGGSGPIASQSLAIHFADANGNEINGSAVGVGSYAGAPSFPTVVGGFATVPAGARRARVELFVTTSGSGSGVFTGAHFMVSGASPGQSVLPAYTPGPATGDPAALVNANATLIQPGKIQLTGGTTLTNWLYGGDNTLINGGAVAANTITANKVSIGLRGINPIGWSFSTDRVNHITWNSGYLQYTDDNGSQTQVTINASQFTWNPGTAYNELYVYFNRASQQLLSTQAGNARTTIASDPNNIIMAVYRGGTDLTVNVGRTIIDGDYIKTGTLSANAIIAGTITANKFLTDQGVDLAAIVPGSLNSKLIGYTHNINQNQPQGGPYGPYAVTSSLNFQGQTITVAGSVGIRATGGTTDNPAAGTIYLATNLNNQGWQLQYPVGGYNTRNSSTLAASISDSRTPSWGYGNTAFGIYVNCDNGGATLYNIDHQIQIIFFK